MGAATDTAVLDKYGTDLVKKHAPGERLASVALVTTGRHDFFFVTEDASTQSSRILKNLEEYGFTQKV